MGVEFWGGREDRGTGRGVVGAQCRGVEGRRVLIVWGVAHRLESCWAVWRSQRNEGRSTLPFPSPHTVNNHYTPNHKKHTSNHRYQYNYPNWERTAGTRV